MGPFAAQTYQFFSLDRFGDATANTELQARRSDLDAAKQKKEGALALLESQWLERANANRAKEDRGSIIESACRYLVLAQHASVGDDRALELSAKADKAAEYYHFAANELRRIDLLERSAQAYFNAGAQALRVTQAAQASGGVVSATFELGIRSAGRARSMFDSLGEDEMADSAHALRLDLQRRQRRLERNHLAYALLVIWGGLTRYGTSPSRWFGTLGLALVCMAVLYGLLCSSKTPDAGALLPALQLHNGLGTSSIVTAPFLSVVNLFAFGGYTNITPQNWLGQLILLAQSLVSFFWLGSGATFLTRR